MWTRFRAERRAQVLVATRRIAPLALVLVALAWPFNFAIFTGRTVERATAFGLSLAICAVASVASHRMHSTRAAMPLAVGFTTALGVTSLWGLSLSAVSQTMIGTMATMMLAVALLFPWGGLAQGLVSSGILAGFAAFPDWRALDAAGAFGIGVHVVEGVLLSFAGAVILDRQRRSIFVESVQARALERQRAQLVEVGRELNATVQLAELLPRIVARCVEIVGSASASLVLVDEKRRVLRVAAVHPHGGHRDDLLGLEFPMDGSTELLDALRAHGVLEVPVEDPSYDIAPFMRRGGLSCALVVAVVREDRLLGYLGVYLRRPGARFSDDQRQLATALAHQAAVALVNARLVDDLQAANRLRSEFVSTMSHELRTPLNVIVGYTEMLAEEMHAAPARATLDRIRGASRELLDLIEATLDLGRLESGRDDPHIADVAIPELWDELTADFSAVARSPGVHLEWRRVGDGVLRTDRRKLKIIVKNLLSNAIKYTPAGEIVASCSVDAAGCTISVRDTGIGISEENLPLVFEMFRQGDGSDRRSFGGVGLGLYIVRRLVDQLGGTVSVESRCGVGSLFRVHVPGERPTTSKPAAIGRPPSSAAA